MKKNLLFLSLSLFFLIFFQMASAQVIYEDDFEGSGNINWNPLFYLNTDQQWEENLEVVSNPFGEGNVGLVKDADTSYTGAALVGGDDFSYQYLAIEADVYCYTDTGSTSRYTGIALMADTSDDNGEINTRYVKLVADFDKNMGVGKRLRLYNSELSMQTFSYSFDVKFYSSQIPGGIPEVDGWHKMRLEVRVVNADSVAYWVYFDGNMVGDGPVYDYTHQVGDAVHTPFFPGTFGLFSFQQGASLPGYFDNVKIEQLSATGIGKDKPVASSFKLNPNYPNPFNPSTTISFTLPEAQRVNLSIYNTIGQKVKELISRDLPMGDHEIVWNGTNEFGREVPSGIYYYRLSSRNYQEIRKMILMK